MPHTVRFTVAAEDLGATEESGATWVLLSAWA
jgi:hypothetical protein